MNKLILLIGVILYYCTVASAQIGIGTGSPDPSAVLDMHSTGKGVLVPRMSAANRLGISPVAEGLLVYDTDSAAFFFYSPASSWTRIATGSGLGNHIAAQNIQLNDNWLSNDGDPEGIRIDNSGNTGIGVAAPLEKLQVAGNIMIPGTSSYKYTTAKTNYYAVSPAAFVNEGQGYSTSINSYGVYIPDGSGTSVGYLQAPVNLPNNAIVTEIDGYCIDKDGTYNLQQLQLWRTDAAAGTAAGNSTVMASTPGSTGTNTNIQVLSSTSITAPLINNATYTYYLRWGTMQANVNLIFCKVVIHYTVAAVD